MKEKDIIHETPNLSLRREGARLSIYFEGNTHAVKVGDSPSVESAKKTMERLERYPENLRKFVGT